MLGIVMNGNGIDYSSVLPASSAAEPTTVNIFTKFRDAIKDCKLPNDSDLYLLHWLIARDFDVEKAEKMLRANLEWRRVYRIDYIESEYKIPEVFQKYFPAGLMGQDKKKNPVLVVRYGRADMKGILSSAKKKDYLMVVIGLTESIAQINYKNLSKYQFKPGDSMIQSTVIFDMEGFSMRHITYKPAMDTAIQILQANEANYPESLRKVFVINAPKIFSLAFSIVKPFMNENTRKKINIYGQEADVWKTALLKEIDADQLPVAYGGTMTDPDGNPHCITKVNLGGTVPKSYYFSNQTNTFDTTNKKSVTISSGSKEHLEYQVKNADSIIRWEFFSEESDIAFAIYHKQGVELVPILPHDRVDCHVSPEEGEIRCEEPGTYVVEFDNNFSYLRSKKVWYTITIELATSSTVGNDMES